MAVKWNDPSILRAKLEEMAVSGQAGSSDPAAEDEEEQEVSTDVELTDERKRELEMKGGEMRSLVQFQAAARGRLSRKAADLKKKAKTSARGRQSNAGP